MSIRPVTRKASEEEMTIMRTGNRNEARRRWRWAAWVLSAIMLLCCFTVPLASEAEQAVPYLYKSWDVRDPFVVLLATKVKPELLIHELTLTGIIGIGGGKVAIFKRYKGPKQTYQLRGARLYGKDGKVVSAIRGKVLDAKTVLLIQGDEEIPFKLGGTHNFD